MIFIAVILKKNYEKLEHIIYLDLMCLGNLSYDHRMFYIKPWLKNIQ